MCMNGIPWYPNILTSKHGLVFSQVAIQALGGISGGNFNPAVSVSLGCLAQGGAMGFFGSEMAEELGPRGDGLRKS